jgi:hypothetical protein
MKWHENLYTLFSLTLYQQRDAHMCVQLFCGLNALYSKTYTQ